MARPRSADGRESDGGATGVTTGRNANGDVARSRPVSGDPATGGRAGDRHATDEPRDVAPGRATLRDAVERVLLATGPGDVVTYGEVAAEAGYPGAARAVGRLLAGSDGRWPWWRVVNASGRLVPGHEAEHAQRLAAEGVSVRNDRVPLSRSRSSSGSSSRSGSPGSDRGRRAEPPEPRRR